MRLLKNNALYSVLSLSLIVWSSASAQSNVVAMLRLSRLQQEVSLIDSLLSLRRLSFEEVLKRYSFTPGDIEPDAAYEKLEGLTAVGSKASAAPHFFFRKDKLVMIYFTAEALATKNLTTDDFVRRYGKQNVRLRSRAGKTHYQLVYPAQGVAFSTDGVALDFLEIFPPTTKAAYMNEIYREVAPFIK